MNNRNKNIYRSVIKNIYRSGSSSTVLGANALDADLVVDSLADGAIATPSTKLAPLNAFSATIKHEPLNRGNLQVTVVDGAATGQQNPTNFEAGNSTTTNVAVAINHETLSFHVSNDDRESGLTLEKLAEKNAGAFALQLSKIWTAKMLVATFGPSTQVDAWANFGTADLPEILALAKNYSKKSLILDAPHWSALMPTDRNAFKYGEEQRGWGFDGVHLQTDWTSATVSAGTLVGVVCDDSALAVAAGRPASLPNDKEFLRIDEIIIPGIGLPITQCIWFNRAKREIWCSYELMFGAAAADTGAAEILHHL